MSENTNTSPPDKANASSSKESQRPKIVSGGKALQKATAFACVVLAVLLSVQWFSFRSEIASLRSEVARRLQLGDNSSKEVQAVAASAQVGMQALQARVNILETKQAEAIADQATLSQIYRNISKNRDEWALAEVENVLSTASQQLQISGNVQGALVALQNAEKNLNRIDKLRFAPVLRAISEDEKKLRALPEMDLTGVATRLDEVIDQVDKMPLLADYVAGLAAAKNKGESQAEKKSDDKGSVGNKESDWWQPYLNKVKELTGGMFSEVDQLVRVRQVKEKDALLVSPDQAYFIRENLKLRLLSARSALLSRNEAIFTNDIGVVQGAIVKYFDLREKLTQPVLQTLNEVKASKLRIQMPALESLNAVYNFKSKN